MDNFCLYVALWDCKRKYHLSFLGILNLIENHFVNYYYNINYCGDNIIIIITSSIIPKPKVKLATLVKGDLKVPFSIATTLRCREGHHSFPWIAPLYLLYVPYNAECYAIYHVPFFESLVWLDLRLNPGLLGHWQTLNQIGQIHNSIMIIVLSQQYLILQ